jgi:hypothetical protein
MRDPLVMLKTLSLAISGTPTTAAALSAQKKTARRNGPIRHRLTRTRSERKPSGPAQCWAADFFLASWNQLSRGGAANVTSTFIFSGIYVSPSE